MFIYFLLFLNYMSRESFSVTIFSKGTLPLDKNSVALQFYFKIMNENHAPCWVGTSFKRCCSIEKDQDCNSMFLYGNHVQKIMPGGQETLVFVYPSVFHHDKRGICYIKVTCKCGYKMKRKILEIPFDTRITKLSRKSRELKRYIGQKIIRNCDSIDEDALDDCSPVDCGVKYMDEKPFYDENVNKCVRAATCIGDLKNDLPTSAYLPTVNLCRDLEHPVEIQDIYAINNGMSIVTDIPKVASDLKAEIESNCSTLSQKLGLLEDIVRGKMNPNPKGVKVDYSNTCKITILSILGYIVCLCAFIVAFVCCMHGLKWMLMKWQNGEFEDEWRNMKQTIHKNCSGKKQDKCGLGRSTPRAVPRTTSRDNVRDGLLRDVINSSIPLELRSSVIDVCGRIKREVKWKKRYRVAQTGTPFECDGDGTISSASSADSLRANTSATSEDQKLLE
ncbi:uncharacterized protein LOC134744305 [Cydia strobilella]|uniref:uncharacterized protein LOC134744305 n=1 Tax=Cydia strobilella TaxID=1100964 RepID=UPI003003EFE2